MHTAFAVMHTANKSTNHNFIALVLSSTKMCSGETTHCKVNLAASHDVVQEWIFCLKLEEQTDSVTPSPHKNRFHYDQKIQKPKQQQKSSYLAGFYPNNARVFVALFLLFFLRMNAFKFHLQKASMQEASSKISAFTAGQIIETQWYQTSHNFS